MSENDIQALQNLLRVFTQLANDNDIPYYLDSGNLLALDRGLEMMPWDDDIDIAMDEANVPKLEMLIQLLNKKVEHCES